MYSTAILSAEHFAALAVTLSFESGRKMLHDLESKSVIRDDLLTCYYIRTRPQMNMA